MLTRIIYKSAIVKQLYTSCTFFNGNKDLLLGILKITTIVINHDFKFLSIYIDAICNFTCF